MANGKEPKTTGEHIVALIWPYNWCKKRFKRIKRRVFTHA
jgi:hypothetical protein